MSLQERMPTVRIPLDYYRILGIPFQTITEEQLRQAYNDRSLQLPRREYSERAIASRQKLLDEAYTVLSNQDRRLAYEREFLAKTELLENLHQTSEAKETGDENSTPSLEITQDRLLGALSILYELGEYEIVIRLAELELKYPPTSSQLGEDLQLTLALSYFELSREQWQQEEYEQAATSGVTAYTILAENQLFPHLGIEIEKELCKLRPYRILSLLSSPEAQTKEREKGQELLREMLCARKGIEGRGEDYSGLSLDDFLLFIQQIRVYLTVAEQQSLFDAEAKRPSTVANYLRIYTLMAQGFAERKPDCILRAKTDLGQLSKRQDVYLELAVCCLLLGQIEEATQALVQCQDLELLEFIKEYSSESEDLLPGLCFYAEHWLQTQVFAHFRDLVRQKASLTEYFAEENVQKYLEKLSGANQVGNFTENVDNVNILESAETILNVSTTQEDRHCEVANDNDIEEIIIPSKTNARKSVPNMKQHEQNPIGYTAGNVVLKPPYTEETPLPSRPRRRPKRVKQTSTAQPPTIPVAPLPKKTRKKNKKFLKRKRLTLILMGVLGLTVAGSGVLVGRANSPLVALEGQSLTISLNKPPLEIPPANAQVVITGNLSQELAKDLIDSWLMSKTQAMGKGYQIDTLKGVLAEPMLSIWQNRARSLQKARGYYQYQHQVVIRSFKTDPQNPNQALVEAQIQEKADYYQNGKLNSQLSYNDNLVVRYKLVRKYNQWKIESSQLVR